MPYICLTIGLIAIAISLLYKSKKGNLKQIGISAEGIIFKQDKNSNYSDAIINNDIITVRFVTQKKEWITG